MNILIPVALIGGLIYLSSKSSDCPTCAQIMQSDDFELLNEYYDKIATEFLDGDLTRADYDQLYDAYRVRFYELWGQQ